MDPYERWGLDPRYYRFWPDGTWRQLAPAHCPAGHPLGPGRVVTGTSRVGMDLVTWWKCEACGAEWCKGGVTRRGVPWPGVDPQRPLRPGEWRV